MVALLGVDCSVAEMSVILMLMLINSLYTPKNLECENIL
jgi:hypothetical protein